MEEGRWKWEDGRLKFFLNGEFLNIFCELSALIAVKRNVDSLACLKIQKFIRFISFFEPHR